MIPREIQGPQEQFERSGAQYLRDVRPLSVRIVAGMASQFSGILLGSAAAIMLFEPALIDLIVPAAGLYAFWVLTRRVKLPMRLPKSARQPDWNHPDPKTRKPLPANGIIYLGRDWLTGQELWITSKDGRQHATVPGTTGAGKTATLISYLSNALMHASGFVDVDGKADNELFGSIAALARRFGRDDDVLALNFLVASGAKDSNTWNPFVSGNADAIREMLASQLGEQRADDPNGVFRGRAIALIGTVTPVLAWVRDHKGISINIETIRGAMELRCIWKVAMKRVFEHRDPQTGKIEDLPIPDMPEDLVYPLQAYLGELPGYDLSFEYNQQKSEKPSEQHGYALMYFTQTFAQMIVSLGHIFRCDNGDIIMRDVVLNRRILVCNLPALENSDDTQAALGKLIIAGIRGMMAETLGARLEGDFDRIVVNKPGMGAAPFQICLDELTYYAGAGLDRMLAMGRGLNVMFWLAFQEVGGLWARLGEKTGSLLGNANLTVGMRLQDGGRTRQWLEQTAGDAPVVQATSYHGGAVGDYREAGHAEIRQAPRVNWNDLLRLIEGEAIMLFAGRRIYAKVFYAEIDTSGPMRLNRPIMLAPPGRTPANEAALANQAAVALIRDLVDDLPEDQPGPTLAAMIEAMAAAAAGGSTITDCIEAAFEAAGRLPWIEAVPADPDDPDQPVVTEFTPMLDTVRGKQEAAWSDPGSPADPIDTQLLEALIEVERSRGRSEQDARRNALAALAERDAAFTPVSLPEPPHMSPEELCRVIDELSGLLELADDEAGQDMGKHAV